MPEVEGDVPAPRVTVSLVSYNGASWLPACLATLAQQDLADYELLIWDNASRDDSAAIVKAWASEHSCARVTVSDVNVGYAAAHNRHIQAARGEFVLLLNQDAQLERDFLSTGVTTFAAHPEIGAVQARLRQLGESGERLAHLDTTGLQMGRDRRAISRAQGLLDGPQHRVAGPVWGVDGPAPMYRLEALRDARMPRGDSSWEVLDEDFFLYKEDVDLAWRLGLLGWGTWYEPALFGWHARGTGGTGATSLLDIARTNRTIRHEAKALSWRNQRLMQIKNETLSGYLVDLPWIARRELLSLAFIMIFDPRRLSAVLALIRAAPGAMRKRRYLQARLHRTTRAATRQGSARSTASPRRRAYDRLPSTLRRPARSAYDRLGDVAEQLRRSTSRRAGVAPLRGDPVALDSSVVASEGPGLRGTILVVDDRVPEYDMHAGALTTFHYLRVLREAGLHTVFRPDDGLRREPYASELEALGVHLLVGDMDLRDWIEAHGAELDQVLLARPLVARRWLRWVRRFTRARVLYLGHDLHHLRERRRHDATQDAEALSYSRRLLEIETDIFREVDVVLTFSPDEVAEIEALAPETDVRVITPAFYERDSSGGSNTIARRPMHERTAVIFVGDYDHLPNVDAAVTLVRQVMPVVWGSHPNTRVLLIGGHVPEAVRTLASELVAVTGHVPSLAPYWADARVSVSALRFGSGVKGKIIASLEAGVPVVTTSIGNEGIGLIDGREALVGDTPVDLAAHITLLLDDPQLAESLSVAGARVFRRRFSEDRVRSDLVAELDLA